MPYIYKITNLLNGKLYIGQTSRTVEERWKEHQRDRTRRDFESRPLYRALNKYGIENFSIETIEETDNPCEREKFWIEYYSSYKNGYNATIGGDGLQLYDYDYIWELWEQGNTIKQISSQVSCNDYVVRTVLDIHNVSTQERKVRSEYRQKESHALYCRKVNQIDIETGEVIHTYSSVREAALAINGDNSNLSRACKNKRKAYGYKWEYQDDEYVKKDFSAKPVQKLDLETGEVLEEYPSCLAAAKAVGGDSSYISKVCRGIQKTSKGFRWRFKDSNI